MLLFDYTVLSSIFFFHQSRALSFSVQARLKHIGANLLKQCHASILITFAAQRINPLSLQFAAHSHIQATVSQQCLQAHGTNSLLPNVETKNPHTTSE